MVPIFVPVPVTMGAVAPGDAGAGSAAVLVCAHAEIMEKIATVRRERRSLLVIVLLKLLGTLVPLNMLSGMSLDYPCGNAEPYYKVSLAPFLLDRMAAVRRY
jgi:hypothetical protein